MRLAIRTGPVSRGWPHHVPMNLRLPFIVTRHVTKMTPHQHDGKKWAFREIGPLSTSDLEIQNRLDQIDSKPTEILRESVKESTVSHHVIRLCLFTQWSRAVSLPRKDRHTTLHKQGTEGLARLVMAHLLNDQKLFAFLIANDETTLHRLSFYAIVEGLEDTVIDWVFVQITDESNPLTDDEFRDNWRQKLLISLMEAHYLHARNDCNPLLRCMLKIIDKAPDSFKYLVRYAGRRCLQLVCTQLGGVTDGALYDKFVEWWAAEGNFGPPIRRAHSLALLHLFHPHHPKEEFALQYLNHLASLPSAETEIQGERLAYTLQRTFDVALINNNTEVASWIRKEFKSHLDSKTGRFAPLTKRDIASRALENHHLSQSLKATTKDNSPINYYYK